jgi:hypothetical protein
VVMLLALLPAKLLALGLAGAAGAVLGHTLIARVPRAGNQRPAVRTGG